MILRQGDGLSSFSKDNSANFWWKRSAMKLSGVSIFWEYAKNFKSNLILIVILVLESKGLYNICTAAEDGRHISATSPSDIVKLFNHYFVSVFTQNAEICCPDCVDEVFANPELCDLVFTTNQVLAVLSILSVYKSSGPDKIPARILKETAHCPFTLWSLQ